MVLTQDESLIAFSIEQGQLAYGSPESLVSVRGSFLRRLLLELPVRVHGEQASRVILVPQTGLQLKNLFIASDPPGDAPKFPDFSIASLDLTDACGQNGESLKPLLLERCLFDGPLHLSRARLRRLSLAGSFLTHVRGNGIRIDGSLDLSYLSSAENHPAQIALHGDRARSGAVSTGSTTGLCWIEMHNAHIADDVELRGAFLAAPPSRSQVSGFELRNALDLSGSIIRGGISLRDGFTAIGGVSLIRANIGGSIWASGAYLVAIESNALDLSGSSVRGNVRFDFDPDAQRRFRAEGLVVMANAKFETGLFMTGAILRPNEAGYSGLWAWQLQILGVFDLTGSVSEQTTEHGKDFTYLPFECYGGVNLGVATIGGSLTFDGAQLHPDSEGIALRATGITVKGHCSASIHTVVVDQQYRSFRFRSWGVLQLTVAQFMANLILNGASLRFDRNTTSSVSSERNFFLVEASQITCVGDLGLTFSHAVGFATFRFICGGSINLIGGTFNGRFSADGANIACSRQDATALAINGARLHDLSCQAFVGITRGKYRLIRFELSGSLLLQNSNIGGFLFMRGASFRKHNGESYLNATACQIQIGAYFDPFELTIEGHSFKQVFTSEGKLLFLRAQILGILNLTGAMLGSIPEDDTLVVSLATIHWFDIEDCKLIGSVSATDGNFTSGVSADRVHIVGGSFRFPGSSAKLLQLRGCRFIDSLYPVLLNLHGARIEDTLTIGLSIQRTSAKPHGKALYFGALDNLSVGNLDDAGGKGWGENFRLRLEHFNCTHMTRREAHIESLPVTGVVGRVYQWLSIRRREASTANRPRLASLFKFFEQSAGEIFRHQHIADAHVAWLNLQYEDPANPKQNEFTPGSYDKLAKVLREEGHDTEAKKVLSAKFSVKRKVDVPPYSRLAWLIYGRFFDYGLSARHALLTLFAFIIFGSLAVAYADSSLSWLHHKGVLVVSSSTVNTIAVEDRSQPDHLTTAFPYVNMEDAGLKPFTGEIPCGGRIDPILYAVESFVPALDLGQTKLCEISSERRAEGWRLARAIYAILGWIVTSITVLTVPGILRSRAESE